MDRLTLGLVAGVLALAAVTVTSAVVLHRQPAPTPATPAGAVGAFVAALHERQPDRALALVAPEALPDGPRLHAFRDAVLNGPSRPAGLAVLDVEQTGDRARIQYEVTAVAGDLYEPVESQRHEVELRRDGDRWLITSDPDPWQFE